MEKTEPASPKLPPLQASSGSVLASVLQHRLSLSLSLSLSLCLCLLFFFLRVNGAGQAPPAHTTPQYFGAFGGSQLYLPSSTYLSRPLSFSLLPPGIGDCLDPPATFSLCLSLSLSLYPEDAEAIGPIERNGGGYATQESRPSTSSVSLALSLSLSLSLSPTHATAASTLCDEYTVGLPNTPLQEVSPLPARHGRSEQGTKHHEIRVSTTSAFSSPLLGKSPSLRIQ